MTIEDPDNRLSKSARTDRHQVMEANNMNPKSLSCAITVRQTPQQVFDAINNVRGWWAGDIDGQTDQLGAEFTYRYKDLHRSVQKITELSPGKKVVWHIVDAELTFVKNKREWNGTDVVFEIAKKGDKTELRFTHVGLLPSAECYEDCSDAWGHYITSSLKNLIETGKGEPNE
jgi:hypothetical protein